MILLPAESRYGKAWMYPDFKRSRSTYAPSSKNKMSETNSDEIYSKRINGTVFVIFGMNRIPCLDQLA